MIEDFNCITINGGMFSAEFLIKVADGDATIEGTNPSTYGHQDSRDLNNYISALWGAACHTWNTLGQKAIENEEVATHSKSFIKRLLSIIEINVGTTTCPTSGDRPQIWRQTLGSVWHVVAAGAPLDERSEAVGARRISPHSLVQGHLNSENDHQWGVVSNGIQFRILRSNNRPSVTESIEFDLQKMFSERHFGDFKMFYMMVHASRWPSNAPEDSPSWLDSWYKASGQQGMSVLADLQLCVEKAAECFGSGFVRLSAGNIEFRQALRDQPGLADEMQRQLMRFIYQLIFIFVTEDRDILLVKPSEQMGEEQVNAVEQARMRYETSYSTSRRRSTLHFHRMDNHFDGYEELKVILSGLRGGYDGLALPALGSFLFSENSTPLLDPLRMLNRDYIAGLHKLCTFIRDGQNHRVHWKTLRETELGSVYESLLELRPIIDMEQGTFELQNKPGNDRKSSGSYYTPRDLVDHLITTTIEPLLEEAKSEVRRKYRGTDATPNFIKNEKIEAILSITVCDPASGSGHFLLAALERIAVELAKIDSEEVYPAPSLIQRWKRDVASRCIYGVDLNPTAVELCKVAIWMDTYDGSRPLSFLDSHIRHGNSLLGQRIENAGLIPDDAIPKTWKEERTEHKKHNKFVRKNLTDRYTAAIRDIDSKLKSLERVHIELRTEKFGSKIIEEQASKAPVERQSPAEQKAQLLQKMDGYKSDRISLSKQIKRLNQSDSNLTTLFSLPEFSTSGDNQSLAQNQDPVEEKRLLHIRLGECEEAIKQTQNELVWLSKNHPELGIIQHPDFADAGDNQALAENSDPREEKRQLQQRRDELQTEIKQISKQLGTQNSPAWSGIPIQPVLARIAEQQARINSMSEENLDQLSEKSGEYALALRDPLRQWAKELLDSTMAMWWWPDPECDENENRIADPPSPLGTRDLGDYALWLARECGVAEQIIVDESTARVLGNTSRYRFVREHTARIAQEQHFFHWELEFAEVFFPPQ